MDPIIEKLKKLLRLGQSSNQHEAELAIERAFELAARHNIDMASVDVDEETKRILHKKFKMGQRLSLIRKLAIQLVHNYFNVNAVVSRPDVILVGTETDVAMASYVLEFIVGACSRAAAAYARSEPRKLTEKKRKSFIAGFFYGVSAKLGGMKENLMLGNSQNELVLRREIERNKYVDDNFNTHDFSIERPRKFTNEVLQGFAAGSELEIHKAVDGKRTEGRLLTA